MPSESNSTTANYNFNSIDNFENLLDEVVELILTSESDEAIGVTVG